jgi:hypothetical protein
MFLKLHTVNREGELSQNTLDLNLAQVECIRTATKGGIDVKRLTTAGFNCDITLEEYHKVVVPAIYTEK